MELDAGVIRAAEQLYGLPRSEFTRARGEWVKQAKADGDRPLADAIGKLRRPTVAAWLVNQLARQRPDELAGLISLGDALRAAHEQLDGAALRELSTRRREVLAGLQHSATEIADGPVTDSVSRELEEMFTGALAAEGSSAALVSGRLSSAAELTEAAHSWPAVSPDARPRPVLVRSEDPASQDRPSQDHTSQDREPASAEPTRARGPERSSAESGPSPALRKARDELARAEAALVEAEQQHEEAQDSYRSATDEETAAHQLVARLRTELITAEQAERSARQRGRFARRQRDDADRQLRERERKLAVARDRLAALEP